MCTVSFVPLQSGFVLTSNRDEIKNRTTIAPKVYSNYEVKLMYPKDELGGGTWIVAKDTNTCIVLLNGAFINHHKKINYSKSRGIILIEIVQAQFPIIHFQEMNLTYIEPFTLIILQDKTLTEVKWDGIEKYVIPKSIKKAHIWSSATLYTRSQRLKRKLWLESFCRNTDPLSTHDIISFHSKTEKSNTEYGLLINHHNEIMTISITQVLLKDDTIEMTYIDRINNTTIEKITF